MMLAKMLFFFGMSVLAVIFTLAFLWMLARLCLYPVRSGIEFINNTGRGDNED